MAKARLENDEQSLKNSVPTDGCMTAVTWADNYTGDQMRQRGKDGEPVKLQKSSSQWLGTQKNKNTQPETSNAQSRAKEAIMSLLVGKNAGGSVQQKDKRGSGPMSKLPLPMNKWTTPVAVQKIQSRGKTTDSFKQPNREPSQLQALLKMPKEQLKKNVGLSANTTLSKTMSYGKIAMRPKGGQTFQDTHNGNVLPSPIESTPLMQQQPLQQQQQQLSSSPLQQGPAQALDLPSLSEDTLSENLSAYLYPSYQHMITTQPAAASSSSSSSVPPLPLSADLINSITSSAILLNNGLSNEFDISGDSNNDMDKTPAIKKRRIQSDSNGMDAMKPWQATLSTTSDSTPDSRQRRYQRTRLALEKSGLLDVTMKTAQLMHENEILDHEIVQLKNDVDEFVQSVMHQQDPDVRGYMLSKFPSLLMVPNKNTP